MDKQILILVGFKVFSESDAYGEYGIRLMLAPRSAKARYSTEFTKALRIWNFCFVRLEQWWIRFSCFGTRRLYFLFGFVTLIFTIIADDGGFGIRVDWWIICLTASCEYDIHMLISSKWWSVRYWWNGRVVFMRGLIEKNSSDIKDSLCGFVKSMVEDLDNGSSSKTMSVATTKFHALWSYNIDKTCYGGKACHLDEQSPKCLEDWENLDFQDLVVDDEGFQVVVHCCGGEVLGDGANISVRAFKHSSLLLLCFDDEDEEEMIGGEVIFLPFFVLGFLEMSHDCKDGSKAWQKEWDLCVSL
nr:hypothetical protein [Tanacetum cinerariifolium]